MFHINLKNKRLKCGLSQKQVADYLNVTPQSVSKWEKGDSLPSIDYLPKLSECFGCDINAFFESSAEKAIDNKELNDFFMLEIDSIYNEKKESEEIYDFLLEHVDIVEKVMVLCNELKAYQTVQMKVIQGLLACSESEAKLFTQHLVECEMLEKLDIGDAYFVVKDSVDGFITLLKLQRRLSERKLREIANNSL